MQRASREQRVCGDFDNREAVTLVQIEYSTRRTGEPFWAIGERQVGIEGEVGLVLYGNRPTTYDPEITRITIDGVEITPPAPPRYSNTDGP